MKSLLLSALGVICLVNISLQICITPSQLILQAKSGDNSPQKTITITNSDGNSYTLTQLAFVGTNAGDFGLADAPAVPHVLAENSQTQIKVGFHPATPGPKRALLNIHLTDGSVNRVISVEIGGLALDGDNEGSLQWIIDTYNLHIASGDDNAADPLINSVPAKQTAPLIGDEVPSQRFEKAGNGPVTVQALATFGPTANNPVVKVGWYTSGNAASAKQLFQVGNIPTQNGLTVDPALDDGAVNTFEPGDALFGFWSEWPFFDNRRLYSEDSLNTFAGAIPHHVRVYPVKDDAGNVVPFTYVVATEEYTANFDFNDIVLLVKNVKPATSMMIKNMDAYDAANNIQRPGLFNDWLIFNNIGGGLNNYGAGYIVRPHTNVNVRFYNRGNGNLVISKIDLNTDKWNFAPNMFPVVVTPGGFHEITVNFVEHTGYRGIREGTMKITSNDPVAPVQVVNLRGAYMGYVEGENEFPLHDLIPTFGYKIGIDPQLHEFITSPLSGEEVRSHMWQRADPTKPLYMRNLASFAHVDNQTVGVDMAVQAAGGGGGMYKVDGKELQTVLPHQVNSDKPAEMWINPNGAFSFLISGEWSSTANDAIKVRFWPIRDRTGALIPFTYFMAHDFILPLGCGPNPGQANCDFNDNLFVVSNLKPVDAAWTQNNFIYDLGSNNLQLAFDKDVGQTVDDKAGLGTGFTFIEPNKDDYLPRVSSYDVSALKIDTAAKTFTIDSRAGTFDGKDNSLVNSLSTMFAAGTDTFFLNTAILEPAKSLKNTGNTASMTVGGDRDNFARLSLIKTATGVQVEFYAEIAGAKALQYQENVPQDAKLIELFLIMFPASNTIQPAIRVNQDTVVLLKTKYVPDENSYGYFFGPGVHGGLYVSHTGAGTSVTFARFVVAPGNPSSTLARDQPDCLGYTEIPVKTTGAVVTGGGPGHDELTTGTTGTTGMQDMSTTGVQEVATTGVQDMSTTGMQDMTTTGIQSDTQPSTPSTTGDVVVPSSSSAETETQVGTSTVDSPTNTIPNLPSSTTQTPEAPESSSTSQPDGSANSGSKSIASAVLLIVLIAFAL